jgi:hypothetical protein
VTHPSNPNPRIAFLSRVGISRSAWAERVALVTSLGGVTTRFGALRPGRGSGAERLPSRSTAGAVERGPIRRTDPRCRFLGAPPEQGIAPPPAPPPPLAVAVLGRAFPIRCWKTPRRGEGAAPTTALPRGIPSSAQGSGIRPGRRRRRSPLCALGGGRRGSLAARGLVQHQPWGSNTSSRVWASKIRSAQDSSSPAPA